MNYYFVDIVNNEAESEAISLKTARERLADMWNDDDYWYEHFETEKEFDEYIDSIFTCDLDELSERLAGRGYAVMTKKDISCYNEMYKDEQIFFAPNVEPNNWSIEVEELTPFL